MKLSKLRATEKPWDSYRTNGNVAASSQGAKVLNLHGVDPLNYCYRNLSAVLFTDTDLLWDSEKYLGPAT